MALSFHRSFLISVTATYLLGQACAVWGWNVFSPLWIASGVATVSLAFFLLPRGAVALLFCALLSFSLANIALQRTLAPQLPANHLRALSLPQEVAIEGWLYREPDRFPHRSRLYLEALRLWRNDAFQPARGKLLLNVRSLTGAWQYGDELRLTVRLREPRNFHTPGSFDYESYLARQGIYVTAFLWDDAGVTRIGWQGDRLHALLEHLRREIGDFFSARLAPHTAAVLRALIIGDEGQLTKDTRTAFSRAGVAHVLSISGLHISFVALAAYGVWWWLLGRSRTLLLRLTMPKLAAALTMPVVLFYAGLAGGSIATWRSVVMVLVYLCAILLDRQEEVFRSLALAALLISLLWPGAVLDISFQLSFLSVLSILLGMKQFTRWWETWKEKNQLALHPWRARILYWLATYIAVSLYALLGTAPLTAFHFHQVSLAGVFANLLIVPLLGSGAVLCGLLAAMLLFLHPLCAAPFLFCAGVLTSVGVWLTQRISAWSFAAFHVVTPTALELLLLYGCLCCLLFCFTVAQPRVAACCRYGFGVLLLALSVDVIVWLQYRYFHQDLRVSFLDVGQGDAAVVELPGSQVMLIDGGGFASEGFDAGEAILAPFLWSRKIARVDILVMSHPQLDHYGGLAFIAEEFAPREFWFNGERASVERFARLWAALVKNGVTLHQLCREEPVPQFSEVTVQILHPPCQQSGLDTNNASLVLRLSHGAIDFLFSGDLEAEGERILLTQHSALASEILKAPHHGSRTSSTTLFIGAVAPQVVVASLGYRNRFGFPAEEVVRRYENQHAHFLRTDLHGAVLISSNGQSYTIETTQLRAPSS